MIGRALLACLTLVLAPATWAQAQAPASPQRPPLTCAGGFTQGGVVVCKTAPGAVLMVDGVERGAADRDGWAIAGFARDAKATAIIAARAENGAVMSRRYKIARRQFAIQRVDGLPPQTVNPTDPEVLKKIEADTILKRDATAGRADLEGFLDGFAWPVEKFRVSGQWGNQRILNGEPRPPHFGIDLAAPTGTTISAPAGGVVTLANPAMHFEGGLVIVDHGQGLFTFYLHMSKIDVKVGQKIAQGDKLGEVGATGRATGPHLCWRMRWRDRQLDPSAAIEGLAAARAVFEKRGELAAR
jgi:murein DD-endopeptidase MepM/ murein hydrolase activator NlpD